MYATNGSNVIVNDLNHRKSRCGYKCSVKGCVHSWTIKENLDSRLIRKNSKQMCFIKEKKNKKNKRKNQDHEVQKKLNKRIVKKIELRKRELKIE